MSGSQPVSLRPLTPKLAERVALLEVSPGQASFVASNAESLSDWSEDPDLKPLAIYVGETVVGFAMYEECTDDDGTIEYNIFRLMIDRRHQGQGYGRKALEALIATLCADPRPLRITTCFVPHNTSARSMYAKFGFVEIDVDEDGEIIAELRRPSASRTVQD